MGVTNKQLKNTVNKIKDKLISIRRDIHMYPELGFEEKRTASIIEKELSSLGIEVKTGVAGTGLVGLIKGRQEKPVVGLRADMDALSITEKNKSSYISRNKGKMHACGHDGHIAILLGVAEVLSAFKEDIPGQVKLIFQPAEEGPGGALPMIEEGVLDNPKVDIILGLHLWQDIPVGKIGIRDGAEFASVDEFDLIIKGKAAHGASPHQGVDAILTASQVINSLQSIVSRNVAPTEAAVITVGKINGGYRRNIIADEVNLEGTVRCFSAELRDMIEKRMEEIISGICQGTGCTYILDYRREYPPLINTPEINRQIKSVVGDLIGQDSVITLQKPTLGGEDFAFFLEKVPGSFFLLGSGNIEKGITAPQHSSYHNIDEDAIPLGVEILTNLVFQLSNKFLEKKL
ncbi:amidohydrolase [Halocella sp. SP3-1]|uniref:M20 metallopeptidase family protein n=1 Tax=Halocella sp. SP3-1 TaxID=2382161 RepID=UPI000F75F579|nr:amidohydrolase [Halocella sp. SP3-1]AZO93624.1 amidohydrolase [Halocella sp. SP3-1]